MSVKCVCPCVLLLGIWLVGGSIQLFLLIPQWKKKVNWMSWYTNLCYFWWFGTKNSTVSHDASLVKRPFGEINNWKTSNTRQEAPAGLCDFGNCWSLKGELGRKWKFSHRPLTPVQWQNMDSNLVKPKFAKVKVKCSEKFRHEVSDYGYGLGKRERRVVALLSWEQVLHTSHAPSSWERKSCCKTDHQRTTETCMCHSGWRSTECFLVSTCWWHKMKWIQFIRLAERDQTNKYMRMSLATAGEKCTVNTVYFLAQ